MTANKTIETWALHAYADGELAAHERVEVERHLEEDIDARGVLDAIRREKAALHGEYDNVLNEKVPYGSIAASQQQKQRQLVPWAAVAAAVAMLAIGVGGGWYGAVRSMPDALAMMSKRALVAHEVYANDPKHFVEVTAAETDHLQKWLSKRIGANVVIPDLTERGYTFLGGRLLAAEERPAGQLVFEDQDKHRIAIFVTLNPDHKDAPIAMEQRGKVWGCYWMDGKFGMAVTGEMSKDDMLALAKDVYDQLEKS